MDLLVLDDEGRSRFAFEAKWWNIDTSAVRETIVSDIAKLRQNDAQRRFLMLFWHEETARAHSKEVEIFCRENHLEAAGEARFEAQYREKDHDMLGQFVVSLLELRR